MNLFFSVIPKSARVSSSFNKTYAFDFKYIDHIVSTAVHKFFPTRHFLEEVSKQCHHNPISGISTWFFSNEAVFEQENIIQNQDIYFKLGYSDRDCEDVFKDSYIDYDSLEKTAGCFSFIKVSKYGVEVVSDAVGSHPLYFYETDKFFLVSSRVNVIVAVVNFLSISGSVEFDVEGCRQFALQGHYFGRHTGFKNVFSVLVHEYVCISSDEIKFYDWFKSGARDVSIENDSYNLAVKDVANALVNSFKFVGNQDLHLSITGGRDSRLIAAALSHIDSVNVRTATMGDMSDPDVFIGKKLAEKLGWQHSIKPISKKEGGVVYAEDPVKRTVRALDVHDCSTSAWDDFSDYGRFSSSPTMSGVGGEILRGGMTLTNKTSIDFVDACAIIDNTMSGGSAFFNEETLHNSKLISAEVKSLAISSPHSALDYYYHKHRNAKWVCSRRAGNRTKWNVIDPLMDNSLVCNALRLPASLRWSERLVFDVIGILTPQIRDLPLEGPRWRFDREGSDVRYKFLDGQENRESFVKNSVKSSYDWRKLQDLSIRCYVKEYLLSNDSHVFNSLFDKFKLESFVENNSYPQTTWHIFTTAVFLNGAWMDSSRPPKLEEIMIHPDY
ncbi:hypothetical protein [Halomonas sp. C22]|uniref:hypothetical protein n=1 Tax=Halomonas sp. C22 TaxID=2580567 RepID=UPI0011A474BB|nr:hypothetical protein [Halomonas sp. C22]